MQRRAAMIALAVAASAAFFRSAVAQVMVADMDRVRREKMETILRIQDLRTPFDSKLVALLSDDDPLVRRRATLAYGSLQDTTQIGLLTHNLTAADEATEAAAAFALGQTGIRLSEKGRRDLEYDLIWNRLGETEATGQLIEEIGKFGTENGLNDLIVRFGGARAARYPERLMMCIARFAIRGIVSHDAVRFLLRYVQPGTATPWQALYALQRVGDNPETRVYIETLRLLYRDPDPLVRMNLATLLAKIRDTTGASEVLLRMAEFDTDWRVRVNAFKALGTFPWGGNSVVVAAFRRAMYDVNPHVCITAISSLPQIGITDADSDATVRETLNELSYMAENGSGGFPWQVQAEAAGALSKIDKNIPRALTSDAAAIYPKLRARLLIAAGESGQSASAVPLLNAAREEGAEIVCAALDGLLALARHCPFDAQLADSAYATALEGLTGRDVAIIATSAAMIGDSLLLRRDAVSHLLEALSHLHPPHDTEAMQEIIRTLGKLPDTRAVQPLIGLLQSLDPSVSLAAATALRALTGEDYARRIEPKAEPLTVDLDFTFLRSLPDVVHMTLKTSRGDIAIDLSKNDAPFTTMSIVKLATQRGFYRGLTFHRVVPNFVVQGGDPRGDGWGGPEYVLRSEFSMKAFETGTVGMASAGKDTEGSQFFITHSPQPHLDGRYTVVGRVVSGMEVVNALQVDDRIYDIAVSP